jgi:alginate O-acetyltransferase complex protein AlgJ
VATRIDPAPNPAPEIVDDEAPTATSEPWVGVATESSWRWTYALAFLAVIVIGFVAAVTNPALRAWPAEPVIDGRWAEAYQDAFDTASPLLAPSRVTWGVIDTAVFGQGRRGVLIGSDGWLFSREEYATVPAAGEAIAAWVTRVAAVRDELASRNAQLVVAIVPAKASIATGHAPAPLPSAAAGRFDALLNGLRAQDVIVSDLRPALAAPGGEPTFLRTDTHWTPAGAAAAAAAIAATVRAHAPFTGLDETPFTTADGEAREHWGDLTAFLDLGPLLERLGPPPDRVTPRTTRSLAPPSDDLFADVAVPVVLVGTSYSADPTWNAVGALREALGSDVIDAAVTGLGPWEPMRRVLAGEALSASFPEVVIWEIPERYVTLAGHVPESAAW